MCYNPISDWSRQFIFLRSMPRFTLWLVVSFQMLKFAAYKQQNSPTTLHISEIFFFDIPCLNASSRSVSSSLVLLRLELSIFLILILRFSFNILKCLKSFSPDLVIVQIKRQTSITTLLVIVALIVTVAVMVAPRMRNTPLVFLGFLSRFFRNSLGPGQLQGLAPRQVFLRPLLQTKQKPCTVVPQESLPRRMVGNQIYLRNGTKSQMIVTLGQPFVGNDAVNLVLRWHL